MKISSLYASSKPVLSFEVFPPKKDIDIENMPQLLSRLDALSPAFISVTCGAGGSDLGAKTKTIRVAHEIQKTHGITPLAHMTCVAEGRADILSMMREMRELGIENVLALRGDLPADGTPAHIDFAHAEDLIVELRAISPDLCIGAACYPEAHIDCWDLDLDISRLRRKQQAGADFFVAQLCFDNALFFRFLDRARTAGVHLPISAGVMPILSRAQIERMIFLCGASLPARIIKLLHKYENDPQALRQAGIEYAMDQAHDLAQNGVDGIHIYTMNHPDIAEKLIGAVRG